ncbi:MAG: ComEC/Rec2 family competence protein, partial [Oscillospiraceae bacterium]
MKRPLFWIGCVFLSTTAAFCHLPPGMALAFGLLAVLFALPLSSALASRGRIAILLLCVLAAGGNFMLRQHLRTSYAAPVLSGPLTVELTLTALEHRGARTRCAGRATLDSPAGEQRTLDASASSFFPIDAAVGDTLRFRARSAGLDPRSGALRLYIDRLLPAPAHPTHPLVSRLARLRRALALRAAALAPDRPGASGVLAAVLTGERAFLPDAEVRALRTAGLSHLVVVSGLHLATLAGVLGTLLSRLSARLRALLLLLFCWSFAVLTGFGPSVVRAAVMLSMLQLGDLLGRPSDGLTSLAAA